MKQIVGKSLGSVKRSTPTMAYMWSTPNKPGMVALYSVSSLYANYCTYVLYTYSYIHRHDVSVHPSTVVRVIFLFWIADLPPGVMELLLGSFRMHLYEANHKCALCPSLFLNISIVQVIFTAF